MLSVSVRVPPVTNRETDVGGVDERERGRQVGGSRGVDARRAFVIGGGHEHARTQASGETADRARSRIVLMM